MRRSKIVNAISMGLGLIEMAVFSFAGYGFPYIQYTLEDEKLFMVEYCTEEEISGKEIKLKHLFSKNSPLEIIEDVRPVNNN